MSAREPAEILAEFGRELRRVEPPPSRRTRRAALAVIAVLFAGGATAVAATTTRAPAPQPPRPAGALLPDRVSALGPVATSSDWSVDATVCRFGAKETIALFMRVPGGGAGRRCDALSRGSASGSAVPPTLFTAPTGRERALLFGAAPARTVRVQALLLRSRTSRAELREIPAQTVTGRPDFVVYVAELPREVRLLDVVGLDADGRPTVRCDPKSCR